MGDDELAIVGSAAVAHHAGYLQRIHWDQAHCARGVGAGHPIGQYSRCLLIRHDVIYPPFGQGVGMIFQGYGASMFPIESRLREPLIVRPPLGPPYHLW